MNDQSERFRRLSGLFDELVAMDGAEREAFIRTHCEEDPGLERELRALLAADGTGEPDSVFSALVSTEAAALQSPDLYGMEIGSWRILEPLGEGGMGTVYLAERADGEYEAKAAIKLVRGGIPSPLLSARFRAERQILASLSHPGVARLLDGGSTADGTPFLVMEFIDGAPITEWCEERELQLEARLRLFVGVCDAVAYAHRELVAHRDLKPSNILVTAEGEPKLLDFGIAKLMDAMGEGADGVTQTYGVMTPAYASPEQVAGGRAGVSADIYSLGVLLYELLAGQLPLQTRGLTPVQLASKITQEVPPLVSTTVPAGAERRSLAGDLDAIVSRCLRKEPEERYASAEALAEDIRLHLDGLPIKVRRDDWAYRTRKLFRRNRGVVSGSLLMLLLGISFTVNALVQARAVARERDRAEAQRATAEQVSGFLEGLFIEADPNQATDREVSVRELLDRGADRVLADLEAEPEVQSALAIVIGRVYRALGEYEASEPLLDSALAVRSRGPAGPMDLGYAYLERGALAYDVGAYDEAVELHETALEAYRSGAAGSDAVEVANALDWIAVSLVALGRVEEAEPYLREAVAMHRRIDPTGNADLASALGSLTDLLRGNGAFEEALVVGEEAIVLTREVYGDDHLELAFALNQHASTLSRSGRPEDAIAYAEEGLAVRRAAFDGPHAEIAASLGNLANIYSALDRNEDALPLRLESADMLREIFPEDHPYVAASTNSVGSLLMLMGRLEEAEPVLDDALRYHRMAMPSDHPNLGYPLTSLGRIYLATERPEAAEVVLREAYDVRRAGLPDRHWHIAASGLELGRALDALGRADEALPLLEEAYALLNETFGDADDRTREAAGELDDHLRLRGLPARGASAGTR